LLRLKGLAAATARDLEHVALLLDYWIPCAVLIDIRLCHSSDFHLVRTAAGDYRLDEVLFVALIDAPAKESSDALRAIGFAGLCRGNCPIFKIADLLLRAFHEANNAPDG
jgi:hypothetical protein